MGSMLYIIAVLLIVFWFFGLAIHIGGALIHILLVAGVILVAYRFLMGRRTV
jgi:hypothetical protein